MKQITIEEYKHMIKLGIINSQTETVRGKTRRYRFVDERKYQKYLKTLKITSRG